MSFEYRNNNQNEENKTPATPTQQSSDYARYYADTPYSGRTYHAPSPYGDQADATPRKKNRKAGKAMAYVAGLLAVGVISGAAGGGLTYSMMMKDGVVAGSSQASTATQSNLNVDVPSQAQSPASSTPATSAPAANDTALLGVAGVVEKTSGSVVEITVKATVSNPFYGGDMVSEGSGSGVVLTADGYIVTNNHVIEGANEIAVRLSDGTEYVGTLVGTDAETDLAVVKIDASDLPTIDFANSDELKVGEVAIAIGNPLGTYGGTVTSGIVSGLNREITIENTTMSNLIQTSAPLNPGNSGGGLFDESGNLIGIVNAKSTSTSSGTAAEGLGFAIPSNTVRSVTDSLIAYGYVTGRPELGISILEISDTQTAFYYRVNEYGVYVASVTKENGLEVGDRIISIEGKAIQAGTEVKAALADKAVGDTLTFVVSREGNEVTVQVPVTEKVPENYFARERIASDDM
jgi:serine protease Do